MRTGASTSGRSRPPTVRAAGHVDASVRPTARIRPTVPVRLTITKVGFHPSDPYVRRFWVAAIGAGAVAELLRLIRTAELGEEVRLPRSLPSLIRAGLVEIERDTLVVANRVPVVPVDLRWRFGPNLMAEHQVEQ